MDSHPYRGESSPYVSTGDGNGGLGWKAKARKITVFLVIVSLAMTSFSYGVSASSSNSSKTSATPITDCGVKIDTPGLYYLENDISTESGDCIKITTSDVILDGSGKVISSDGIGPDVGINVIGEVTNVSVKNVNMAGWDVAIRYAGVVEDNLEDNPSVIENVNLQDNNKSIYLKSSKKILIRKNQIEGNDKTGIYLEDSKKNKISDNDIKFNGKSGLYIDGGNDNWVVNNNNISSNAFVGVGMNNSKSNTIDGNIMKYNDRGGVYVGEFSNGTVVKDNTITDNGKQGDIFGGYGISTYNAGQVKILNNKVNSNENGIYVEGDGTIVGDNEVKNNQGDGIYFYSTGDVLVNGTSTLISSNGGDGIVVDGRGSGSHLYIKNIVVKSNSGWDLNVTNGAYAEAEDTGDYLDLGSSTKSNTKLNIVSMKNVKLKGVSSPSNAGTAKSLGRYFEAESGGSGSYLDVKLNYKDADVYSDESMVSMWRNDGSGWSKVSSTLDQNNNQVSVNLTSFSTFGALEGGYIDGCGVTVDSSNAPSDGKVELTSDISTSSSGRCINITVDGITLNGNGHKIVGPGSGTDATGIGVGTYASPIISNVIVKNVNVTKFSHSAIEYTKVDGGVIKDSEFSTGAVRMLSSDNIDIKSNVVKHTGSNAGLYLDQSDKLFVEDNTVKDTERVYADYSSGTLKNNKIRKNSIGVSIYDSQFVINGSSTVINNNFAEGIVVGAPVRETKVTVSDITVKGNSGPAIEVENDANLQATNLNIGSSTNSDTTVNINGMEAATLDSVSNPPSDPSNQHNIGRYFNATSLDSSSYLDIELQYTSSDVSNSDADESTLSLWRHDGSSWSELTSSSVDTGSNYVSANITSFSVFGAFGENTSSGGGEVNNIGSCTEINEANAPSDGLVNVTSDISASGTCVKITVGGITLDGQGHTITGPGNNGEGIYVHNSSTSISNVNVKNVKTVEFTTGIWYENVDSGSIKDSNVSKNNDGIVMSDANDIDVLRNTLKGNSRDGIEIGSSSGALIRDNTVQNNDAQGISLNLLTDSPVLQNNFIEGNGMNGTFIRGATNVVINGTSTDIKNNGENGIAVTYGTSTYRPYVSGAEITGNSGNAILVENVGRIRATNVNIGSSTKSDTKIDINDARNVSIDDASNVPSDPSDKENIGRYVDATSIGPKSYLDFEFKYTDSDITNSGVDESTLSVWHYSGSSWSEVSSTSLNKANNELSANVTTFSTFGAFGDTSSGGGVIEQISSCGVEINASNAPSDGSVEITSDVTDSSEQFCIGINTSDITLKGNNHVLDGTSASNSIGLFIYSPANKELSNITAQNLRVKDWYFGAFVNYTRSTDLKNIKMNKNTYGAVIWESDNAKIKNSEMNSNSMNGTYLRNADGTKIVGSKINNNAENGIFAKKSDNLELDGVTIRKNTKTGVKAKNIKGFNVSNSRITGNDEGGIVMRGSGVGGVMSIESSNLSDNKFGGAFIGSKGKPKRITVRDTVSSNHDGSIGSGFQLVSKQKLKVINVTANGNGKGVAAYLISQSDLIIEDSEFKNSEKTGLIMSGSQNAEVRNTVVSGNPYEDIRVVKDATLTDVEIGSIDIVSAEVKNVSVKEETSPPSLPSDKKGIGKFLNVSNTENKAGPTSVSGGTAYFDAKIGYTSNDISGVVESSLAFWKHDGSSWSEVSGSTVSTGSNYVSANLTTFSVIGILGNESDANIKYSNLQVSKTDINTSEDITVSADIENTGSASGSYNATLKVNGNISDYKTGTLSAGGSTTVSFTTSFASEGKYDVTVDGLTPKTVEVNDSSGGGSANIDYSNLTVSKTQVNVSEDFTVSADIENTGSASGSYNATLKVDGKVVDYKKGTLSAGSSRTVSFTKSFSSAGSYDIAIDGLSPKTVKVGDAQIEYSKLQVSKTQVNLSESFTVSATVENKGSDSGRYNATFMVEGNVMDYRTGTLSPGSSRTVSFTKSFSSGGEYDIAIDGLSPITVDVGNPDIEYSSLSISKKQINKSEKIEITADIKNKGSDSGKYNATLRVNGTVRDYKKGTLSAGSSTVVLFTTSFAKNGTYKVSIAGLPSETVQVGEQTKTIKEAIANLKSENNIVNFSELQSAINFWIQDKEVPGTGGKKIDFAKLQDLISLWVQEKEV